MADDASIQSSCMFRTSGLNDNGICRFKDLHFKYEIAPAKDVDGPEAMLLELGSEGGEGVDDV